MEMPLEQQKPPDISPRRQANELIKLIRKLRWMGMEEETERAETAPRLIGLAAHYSLPAIYQWREFPAEGGLMSYGTDLLASYALCCHYVACISAPNSMHLERSPRRPILYAFTASLGCRDRRTVRLDRAPANTNNTAGAAIRR
jgi:hypothetical protein